MERVIVTGANGFIGRNFIKFLSSKNIEVYAIDISHEDSTLKDLSNVLLVKCPLSKIHTLDIPNLHYDVFYHFAWAGTTGVARADYALQSDNAKYTCDAAMLAKKFNCHKFITTGTITEKVTESILTNHYTSENLIYGLAKLYAHNLLDIVCKKNDVQYVWAKLSNIYGGDNTNGNLISYTLNEFKEGRVPSYGPCEQPYNFTYIKDVMNALYLLGENKTSENEYFISNGECMQLKDYLTILSQQFNQDICIGARVDDGIRYEEEWFNSDTLTKIGFKAKYNFIEGIKEIRGKLS